ncbi:MULTISPECIES: hypothetical protein [Burkholderia cepacia complex]|uniref:hypothetical protein n=1 Tax=Burkholderia cepacia complex TaxID=87882 RepID=UPI0013DD96DC|nr:MULTISPECIES: hypothetical protein [Burkholderia cepacia complex]
MALPVHPIGTSGRRQPYTLPGIVSLPHACLGFLSNSGIFMRAFDKATLNYRTGNQILFDDTNGFADSMASRNPHPLPLNPEIIIEIFIQSRRL